MVVAGEVEDAADVEEDAEDGGGEHHHSLQHLLHLFLHCKGSVEASTSLLSTEKRTYFHTGD